MLIFTDFLTLFTVEPTGNSVKIVTSSEFLFEEGMSYQFELRAKLTGATDGVTVIVLSTPARARPLIFDNPVYTGSITKEDETFLLPSLEIRLTADTFQPNVLYTLENSK